MRRPGFSFSQENASRFQVLGNAKTFFKRDLLLNPDHELSSEFSDFTKPVLLKVFKNLSWKARVCYKLLAIGPSAHDHLGILILRRIFSYLSNSSSSLSFISFFPLYSFSFFSSSFSSHFSSSSSTFSISFS